MSHDIYRVNGRDSMAYVGLTPWHGLGQKLTKGAGIDQWGKEAGLDWTIEKSGVWYRPKENGGTLGKVRNYPDQWILHRSDDGSPLSIVSDRYEVVQPIECLEFFKDFAEAGHMTIETAGSLAGGKKYWALARISDGFNVNNNDMVLPYVLLASSCDKTMATIGKLTSVRVVCNNTLNMSIGKQEKSDIRVTHSTKFDADDVRKQMGLVHDAIDWHKNMMQTMHRQTMTDDQAMKFFIELFKTKDEKDNGTFDATKHGRSISKVWDSYKGAPGSEDTVWGAVNAVTHSVDYNVSARSDDTRLNSAWFGQGAALKTRAYELAQDSELIDIIAQNTAIYGNVERILDMVSV